MTVGWVINKGWDECNNVRQTMKMELVIKGKGAVRCENGDIRGNEKPSVDEETGEGKCSVVRCSSLVLHRLFLEFLLHRAHYIQSTNQQNAYTITRKDQQHTIS
jgi:hypothetical protein